MKVNGKCHCGAIIYEAEVDKDHVGICHCTDCQILSGSAFRVLAYVPEKDFRLLKGKPKSYVKVAESGRRRLQLFCPDCGTSLYSMAEDDAPKTVALRVGAMEERTALTPHIQYWHRSSLPWLGKLDAIQRKERQ